MIEPNYCTALWYPTLYRKDAHSSVTAARFMRRGLKYLPGLIDKAVVRLKRSQQLLGKRLTILLDEKLPSNFITQIKQSGIGIEFVKLNTEGYWRPKWFAIQSVGISQGWPVLWFDFLDAEVCSRFSKKELDFLGERQLVCEFTRYRNFGPPLCFTNGKPSSRSVLQPHTGIFISTAAIVDQAIASEVDHDQIALARVLEKGHQVFQDTRPDQILKFSARGLFRTTKDDLRLTINAELNQFAPRIVHKVECGEL